MRLAVTSLLIGCGFTGPAAVANGPIDAAAHDGAGDSPIVDATTLDATALDAVMLDAVATAIPCANPTLDETFTNVAPCAPWASNFETNGTLVEGGGSLTATIAQNATGGVSCTQLTPMMLTTGGVVVEVPQVISGGGTYTQLQLLKTQSVSFGLNGTQMRYADNSGNPVYHAAAYDPVMMRWWRMRRDASATGVVVDTSPDGSAWTTFFDQPTTLENVRINVIVGSNGGPSSGATKLTRLVICP